MVSILQRFLQGSLTLQVTSESPTTNWFLLLIGIDPWGREFMKGRKKRYYRVYRFE